MTTENPTVAANAVTPNALPLHQLTLIGLMHAGTDASALIRSARGDIAKVKAGDTIGSQTVAAISDDSLILINTSGAQTILQMPS